MLSNLLAIDSSIKTFFTQLTDALGYTGFLAIALGVELLFILLFVIKSAFSYEARLKRSLDKANTWLFKNKKIDASNIKEFNDVIKKGPKRFVYYWQQFILYRDGGPSAYMSEENLIEKPLRTSSWKNNVRNLGILSAVWAAISFVFALVSQYTPQQQYLSIQATCAALVIPCGVLLLGIIAIIAIKGKRVLNLDDIYHLHHLYSRFLTNACAELPPFIDFDLLFTPKEIEKGNAQLREYYEARARKAKEEFENAKQSDANKVEYQFDNVGVDGTLLLNRAMSESETYITKKTSTEAKMAQVAAQLDALRRNYENVQMDLQRKIQASKENIQKLIEQQAATTSRVEVGLLRQQQEKEVNKQEALQKDYDQEEARYKLSKTELEKEIEKLRVELAESIKLAEKGMSAEYQTFFEKVMKSAYAVAERKVDAEKKEIIAQRDKNENELINVQTQIKRLLDENVTLRAKIDELTAGQAQEAETPAENEGHYDEEGNYIYSDGSYHDTKGFFHDVDGKIYDMNGVLIGEEQEELTEEAKQEMLENEQIEQFGAYIPADEVAEETPEITEEAPVEETIVTEEPVATETPVETAEVTDAPVETPAVEETAQADDIQEEKAEEKPTEEKVEEPKVEENAEPATPAKKRGRPRKVVQEEPAKKEPAKRGRPKKETTASKAEEEKPATTAKRGRPRKTTTTEKPKTTSAKSEPAKRGRPKKTETPVVEEPVKKEPAKRGRPRKTVEEPKQEMDTLSKINQLISEEEAKLSRMKALLNSEIDQVMLQDNQVEKEKDEIMEAVETIKEQANDVEKSEKSDEELATINKRLEDLIKEISVLNNKK